MTAPTAELDPGFSSPDADALPWAAAEAELRRAGTFWLTTVRPDGRPHVTPLIAVWDGEAMAFCTGEEERKAANLAANPHVVLTTGRNDLHAGLDVVVEGEAVRVRDRAGLERLAALWAEKYGEEWAFRVEGDRFAHGDHGTAIVFRVAPARAFGFAKDPYGQTRWTF